MPKKKIEKMEELGREAKKARNNYIDATHLDCLNKKPKRWKGMDAKEMGLDFKEQLKWNKLCNLNAKKTKKRSTRNNQLREV